MNIAIQQKVELQLDLPLIGHVVEEVSIDQRATDGYINATAMCKAVGKEFKHYNENKATKEFFAELSSEVGIPTSELVQSVVGGNSRLQGTWVHPQVAIHLGQWASPKFAVLVSKWVFEWIDAEAKESYKFPYHIRRYLINRSKIPATHFSMLDQMTLKLLAALEAKGYIIPANLMPDISLGRMFSGWLREQGHDPDNFPTYQHSFDDGRRPIVAARLYPNTVMTDFNNHLEDWIRSGKAMEYFSKKDSNAIEPLKAVYAELPPPMPAQRFITGGGVK
jgi:hypothetical protein